MNSSSLISWVDWRKLCTIPFTKLFSLPDATVVYPAHDYQGRTESSIANEKERNPRLGGGKTQKDFVDIMANLNLPYPKKIDVAVPANMRCGVPDTE